MKALKVTQFVRLTISLTVLFSLTACNKDSGGGRSAPPPAPASPNAQTPVLDRNGKPTGRNKSQDHVRVRRYQEWTADVASEDGNRQARPDRNGIYQGRIAGPNYNQPGNFPNQNPNMMPINNGAIPSGSRNGSIRADSAVNPNSVPNRIRSADESPKILDQQGLDPDVLPVPPNEVRRPQSVISDNNGNQFPPPSNNNYRDTDFDDDEETIVRTEDDNYERNFFIEAIAIGFADEDGVNERREIQLPAKNQTLHFGSIHAGGARRKITLIVTAQGKNDFAPTLEWQIEGGGQIYKAETLGKEESRLKIGNTAEGWGLVVSAFNNFEAGSTAPTPPAKNVSCHLEDLGSFRGDQKRIPLQSDPTIATKELQKVALIKASAADRSVFGVRYGRPDGRTAETEHLDIVAKLRNDEKVVFHALGAVEHLNVSYGGINTRTPFSMDCASVEEK